MRKKGSIQNNLSLDALIAMPNLRRMAHSQSIAAKSATIRPIGGGNVQTRRSQNKR
jgi:hypothetical protein